MCRGEMESTTADPPQNLHNIDGCLSQYCRHVHTILHRTLKDSRSLSLLLSTGHYHAISFTSPSIIFSSSLSVDTARPLAHFHDAQQQRQPSSWPTAIHAVGATHSASSAFQRKVKVASFRPAAKLHAKSNLLDHLCIFDCWDKALFHSRWRAKACIYSVCWIALWWIKKKKKEMLQPDAPTDEQVVFWNVAGEVNFKQNSK